MQTYDESQSSGTDTVEIGLEDALQLAVQLHQASRLNEAEILYARILEVAPDNANLLHFFGLLKHEQGFSAEGIGLILKSLAIVPDYVDALNNLGNIYLQLGDFERAEPCFRRVVEINPDFAAAYGNLAIALKHCGRFEEANLSLQQAIGLEPNAAHHYQNLANVYQEAGNYPEAVALYRKALQLSSNVRDYRNLANVQRNLGDYAEAVGSYRKSLALDPTDSDTYSGLCRTLHLMGNEQECAAVLAEWLKLDPENPSAKHLLAAYNQADVPMRASDGYVQQTFDRFAASFDSVLQRLDYRAPQLVQQGFERIEQDTTAWEVLDAGCGTGLFGELLRPKVKRLDGVDLSSKMLERAQARNVYDALFEAELTEFLAACKARYHAISCVDTLCYFGDLAAVFRSATDALQPMGWFVFTIEKQQDSRAANDFTLNLHGRYSHSEEYLAKVLRQTGFSVHSMATAVLRKEQGEDVLGLVVVAQADGRTAGFSDF